jgi:hypothetical protein
VQDSLATANGLRPVFEPLHPYVSETANRYAHRALGPGDDAPELREFLAEVCAGRKHGLWTKYRRQLRWLFPPPAEFRTKQDAGRTYRHWGGFVRDFPRLFMAAHRREPLVKCIRANLMLGWLAKSCGWRIVLVVRHPAAVIESELRGAWNATFAIDRFRNDARLDELTNGRYRRLLDRSLSPVEALTLRWVVENQWVLEAADGNGITIVFYEHLRLTPDREWARIQSALELKNAPPAYLLERPSQQSSPTGSGALPKELTNPRWMHALDSARVNAIQSVLDESGVTYYSTRSQNPEWSELRKVGRVLESVAP